ncbi:MAG TPA: hypothetical protein VD810_02200, partial [Methylophilaceae bacterium]|nr:hypothetical protein [Methylophilaceae bacterium]
HQGDGRHVDSGVREGGARHRAQARWQVPRAQRQREDPRRQAPGHHADRHLQFPSEQAVKAFASDPAYAPYAKMRKEGSDSRFQLIDDTDIAGTIPYLPRG